ncbi:hypothetical protein E2C01_047839 [Portunus trituberculatus]|uniref:Uncharacterized protein n=1 Tax=Portunus trituberculatus TaxID=210409 RepID=A0A5B7G8Y4_PORTR|nr:hypothetical protein [Portunus trituberculatus]
MNHASGRATTVHASAVARSMDILLSTGTPPPLHPGLKQLRDVMRQVSSFILRNGITLYSLNPAVNFLKGWSAVKRRGTVG